MREPLSCAIVPVRHGSIAHDHLVVTVFGLQLGDLSMDLDHVS